MFKKKITPDIETILASENLSINNRELLQRLNNAINDLLSDDFGRLVSSLYRLDVSETKLKKLLKQCPETDAANIIAKLIIERQLQKLKSRQQYSQRDNDISEEEKW